MRFKTILSLVLTLLFSISIGGAYHYCGGNLSQFKLLAGNTHVGCAMSMCTVQMSESGQLSSRCCEKIQVKMDVDDYQVSSKPETSVFELLVFNNLASELSIAGVEPLLHRTFFYSHPPDNLFSVDLSRIQVFLI
jgi:hypothetical protein